MKGASRMGTLANWQTKEWEKEYPFREPEMDIVGIFQVVALGIAAGGLGFLVRVLIF